MAPEGQICRSRKKGWRKMSEDRHKVPDGCWESSSTSPSSCALAKRQQDSASWTFLCFAVIYVYQFVYVYDLHVLLIHSSLFP